MIDTNRVSASQGDIETGAALGGDNNDLANDLNGAADLTGEEEYEEDEEQLHSTYHGSLNRSQANLASEYLPKKRTVRKRVVRPKHANNPFLVYSIYFTN